MIGQRAKWPGTYRGEEYEAEYDVKRDQLVVRHRRASYLSPVLVTSIPMRALADLGFPRTVGDGEIAVRVSPEFMDDLLTGGLELPACLVRYDRATREVWINAR